MSYYNYNQMMNNLYSPNTNTSTTPASGPYQYTPNEAPVTNLPQTGGTSMYVPPSTGGGKVLPNNDPLYQIPATKQPSTPPAPYQGAYGGEYTGHLVPEVYDPVLHGGGSTPGRPTIGGEDFYDNRGQTGGIYDFDYSDKQALKSLFSNLNRINLKDPRLLGGGSGGGSEALEGNMDPNRFISLNPYLDQNVTSFNYGGVVKKKDFSKVNYDHGGYHSPYDEYSKSRQRFLKNTGNRPFLGRESHYGKAYEAEKKRREDARYARNIRKKWHKDGKSYNEYYADEIEAGTKTTNMTEEEWAKSSDNPDNLKHGWEEGYAKDSWYEIPDSQKSAERGQIRIERDVIARNPYYEQTSGMYDPYAVPQYFLGGLVKSIMGGAANVFQAIADPVTDLIRPVFDAAGNIVEGASDAIGGLFGGDAPDFEIQERPLPERDPVKQREVPVQQAPQPTLVKGSVNVRQKDKSPGKLREGDFVGNKPNQYVTENVQDELDYAQEGMRMPEIGMQMTNPMTEPEVYNHGGYYSRQVNQALAINQLSGLVANTINNKKNSMAKGGKFKPHMMYDPKTGKGYMANKLQDHLDMKEKGYDHRKRNPKNYPKGAKGMKMKSYTKGGRL